MKTSQEIIEHINNEIEGIKEYWTEREVIEIDELIEILEGVITFAKGESK